LIYQFTELLIYQMSSRLIAKETYRLVFKALDNSGVLSTQRIIYRR